MLASYRHNLVRSASLTQSSFSRWKPSCRHLATASPSSQTAELVKFTHSLQWDAVPPDVISRTKELFADWFGCALAGRNYTSLVALENFAGTMGPTSGTCELIASCKGPSSSSAYFAAMLNGAAGHIVEQDDLHNASVVHPATVVFPAALAAAQHLGSSGKEFLLASVVGYEIACRVGEMLGPAHYRIFHTTGTAGCLGAAAAVAKLLSLSCEDTISALGTAGTQAAGLWEFASDAAMSKQVHTAHAASVGLMSAYTAKDGLLGAKDILLGNRGLAKGTAFGQEDGAALVYRLGQAWKVTETSFKFWASCRHTHPSADALLSIVKEHDIDPTQIKAITAYVYNAALDVLAPAEAARSVHESKFSMGFVLGTVAVKRSALLNDFTEDSLQDQVIREVQQKVTMVHSQAVQDAYPKKWLGHVKLETLSGDTFEAKITDVKGDPENTLSREEITTKFHSLARYGGSALSESALNQVLAKIWGLDSYQNMYLLDAV